MDNEEIVHLDSEVVLHFPPDMNIRDLIWRSKTKADGQLCVIHALISHVFLETATRGTRS